MLRLAADGKNQKGATLNEKGPVTETVKFH
jgi:hypothetical protein